MEASRLSAYKPDLFVPLMWHFIEYKILTLYSLQLSWYSQIQFITTNITIDIIKFKINRIIVLQKLAAVPTGILIIYKLIFKFNHELLATPPGHLQPGINEINIRDSLEYT